MVVSNIFDFHTKIGKFIIPIDFHIFRGVGQPPKSVLCGVIAVRETNSDPVLHATGETGQVGSSRGGFVRRIQVRKLEARGTATVWNMEHGDIQYIYIHTHIDRYYIYTSDVYMVDNGD